MSSTRLEAFLARLYVDSEARASFKANPRAEAKKAGLSDEQSTALENLDCIGLQMAACSFAKKRQLKRRPSWFAAFQLRLVRLRFLRFLQ